MRKIEVIEELVNTQVTTEIKCNACGKEDKTNAFPDMTEINFYFGYGSMYDGEVWTMDLCDACIDGIVNEFKILVEKSTNSLIEF